LTPLKVLVLALALANAGYFLWARGIAPPPPSTVAPGASSLKLATEAAPVGAAASTATTSTAAVPGGAAVPGSAAVSGGAAEPAASAATAGAIEPAASAALLSDVKRCISVGPFADVSEAAHAAATLRSGGYAPRQRVTEGEVWAGVWVYLPLPESGAAAAQLRAKIAAGGIDDVLDMPGPNDAPVISLGLFSDPRRAQARVAQAQKQGLNPATADRKRTGDVYWVDVDLKPTDSLLNPADLQGQSGRIVRLEVKGCPAVTNTP